MITTRAAATNQRNTLFLATATCCRRACRPSTRTGLCLRNTRSFSATFAPRHSSQSSSGSRQQSSQDNSERTRLQWYHIPISLGIAVVGAIQIYKVSSREKHSKNIDGLDELSQKRWRAKPEGPWYALATYVFVLRLIS